MVAWDEEATVLERKQRVDMQWRIYKMNQGGADLFFLLSLPPFSSFLHLFFFISYLTYPWLQQL